MASTLSHAEYRARGYIGELDGVRAIAVILVVAHHVKWGLFDFIGGHYGVYLFFVLSGYLITDLCLREERASGRVSLAAFYVRRTCRIFPLYFFTLTAYTIVLFGLHINEEQRLLLRTYWPGYILYYQEVVREWTDGRMPFVQSWTLGIEEKFYLVWPLFCFVMLRKTRSSIRAVAAVLAALAFATAAVGLRANQIPYIGRCLEPYSSLLCGCTLALVLNTPRCYAFISALSRVGTVAVLTGIMIALQFGVAPAEGGGHGFVWRCCYAIITAIWFAFLLIRDGLVQRVLRSRPMAFLGRHSYGIYLIHAFALFPAHRLAERSADPLVRGCLALLLGVAISTVAAYCLSIVIERPMIRLGRRLSAHVTRKKTSGGEQPLSQLADAITGISSQPLGAGTGSPSAR